MLVVDDSQQMVMQILYQKMDNKIKRQFAKTAEKGLEKLKDITN